MGEGFLGEKTKLQGEAALDRDWCRQHWQNNREDERKEDDAFYFILLMYSFYKKIISVYVCLVN